MAKNLLIICLCCLVLFWPQPILAQKLDKKLNSHFLDERLNQWPSWKLPGPYKHSELSQQLIYPKWFYGNWDVYSLDLDEKEKKIINHNAKFITNNVGNIIADRKFNSESLAKAIFNNDIIKVKEDSKSPNRQLAIFQDSQYLETKIVGRRQETYPEDYFLTDELSLQILHNYQVPRVNQVETLSKYKICDTFVNEALSTIEPIICGEQWQARYSEPGDSLFSMPVSTNHFLLFLIKEHGKIPSNNLLIRLSNRIDS